MVGIVEKIRFEDIDVQKVRNVWKQNGLIAVIGAPLFTYFAIGKIANWEISSLMSFIAEYSTFSLFVVALGPMSLISYLFILRRSAIEAACIRSVKTAQEDVVISSRSWSIIAATPCASFAASGAILFMESHATLPALLLPLLSPIIFYFLFPDTETIESYVRRKIELFNAGELPKQ
jgi:hypothetical protein